MSLLLKNFSVIFLTFIYFVPLFHIPIYIIFFLPEKLLKPLLFMVTYTGYESPQFCLSKFKPISPFLWKIILLDT